MDFYFKLKVSTTLFTKVTHYFKTDGIGHNGDPSDILPFVIHEFKINVLSM